MMNMMINVSSDINAIFSSTKRDPGGIGFIDDVGGNVDGLMSCTESLGFESSDERRVDDRIESLNSIDELLFSSRKSAVVCSRLREKDVKRESKKFPPPLSSLSQDGRPTFFLRPVREDGRLMLTEVKIGRPEILLASRKDGRLRLHLIRDEDEDEDLQEQTEEEGEEKEMQDNQEDIQEKIEESLKLETTEEMVEEVEEKEEELERVEGWQFHGSSGAGDAFRRCHEQVSHHPHHPHHGHHQHVWRQHCVTIR